MAPINTIYVIDKDTRETVAKVPLSEIISVDNIIYIEKLKELVYSQNFFYSPNGTTYYYSHLVKDEKKQIVSHKKITQKISLDVLPDSVILVRNIINSLNLEISKDVFSWKHFKLIYESYRRDFPLLSFKDYSNLIQDFLKIQNFKMTPTIFYEIKTESTLQDLYDKVIIDSDVTFCSYKKQKKGNLKLKKQEKDYLLISYKNFDFQITDKGISTDSETLKIVSWDYLFEILFSFNTILEKLGYIEILRDFSQIKLQKGSIIYYSNDRFYINDINQVKNNLKLIASTDKNFQYEVFEKSIHIILPNNEKIYIHSGTKVTNLDFTINSFARYNQLLNFVFCNNVVANTIIINPPKKLKVNSKDCQKSRQPEIYVPEKNNLEFLEENLTCETNQDFKFPGYTKSGTPCCFKTETDKFNFGNFPKKFSFEVTDPLKDTKEKLSNEKKVNIYLIDRKTGNLIESEYLYDIYEESCFYLWDSITNFTWILTDPKGNTKFKENFNYKLNCFKYPLHYLKMVISSPSLLKKVEYQIVDSFDNVHFLEFKKGELFPIVPQPKVPVLKSKKLQKVDFEKQSKFLNSIKIKWEKLSNDFIRLTEIGILIPISIKGNIELNSLEHSLKNKRINVS